MVGIHAVVKDYRAVGALVNFGIPAENLGIRPAFTFSLPFTVELQLRRHNKLTPAAHANPDAASTKS